MALTVRIAMLNADVPVANVRAARHESYGSMFHSLLEDSARRFSPSLRIESEEFDVINFSYPDDPSAFDAIIITGSAASSYDDKPWIYRLDSWLADVYSRHPHLRIFGSCFGHQIVCQSLLRDHGARVEKDPKGWEIGVHEIQLTDEFVDALGAPSSSPIPHRLPTPGVEDYRSQQKTSSSMRLQFVHADHVVLPSALPPSWITMGRTNHCAVQGVYQPTRVLTYQGHFEFDHFVNSETLKVFGAKWDPAVLQSALDATDMDDDAEVGADLLIRFLLEGRVHINQTSGGLLTPPE